jgi:hypothetical protein
MAQAGHPYLQASLSTSQTLTAGATAKIQCNTKNRDSGGYYDNTTNYRFTPLVAGKYSVRVTLYLTATLASGSASYAAYIYKNGAAYSQSIASVSGAGTWSYTVTADAVVSMNGSTDYLEGDGSVSAGTSVSALGGAILYSFMEAVYLGP